MCCVCLGKVEVRIGAYILHFLHHPQRRASSQSRFQVLVAYDILAPTIQRSYILEMTEVLGIRIRPFHDTDILIRAMLGDSLRLGFNGIRFFPQASDY